MENKIKLYRFNVGTSTNITIEFKWEKIHVRKTSTEEKGKINVNQYYGAIFNLKLTYKSLINSGHFNSNCENPFAVIMGSSCEIKPYKYKICYLQYICIRSNNLLELTQDVTSLKLNDRNGIVIEGPGVSAVRHIVQS